MFYGDLMQDLTVMIIKEICTAFIFHIEWKHRVLYNGTGIMHTHRLTHTHTHHGQMTDTCDPVESLMRDYPSFKTFSATCPFRFTYL